MAKWNELADGIWSEADFVVLDLVTVEGGNIMDEVAGMRATVVVDLIGVAGPEESRAGEPRSLRLAFIEGFGNTPQMAANIMRAYSVAEYQTAMDRDERAESN